MTTPFGCVAALIAAYCASAPVAHATSTMPLALEIRQIGGKPAACLPASDAAADPVRIRYVGVSRSTGPASPSVIYWDVRIPDDAPPVTLRRGECIVYGQTLPGATVRTPPKPLDADRFYGFGIMPAGSYGPTYDGGFCLLTQPGGGVRLATPRKDEDPCDQVDGN
ncbi:hypothetical protein [Burkholderia sp. Ac-20379]|uniref:hypothetical protein n=1 Tax=Burkholderia sp. Ac-20379 TaxID=2703900 RepID=UPI001F122827|nr:hypothetical protein [Burkholderia sp. Ac-20379]